MQRHTRDSLAYYTFDTLTQTHQLNHAITTRHGGTSHVPFHSLNLSHAVGDNSANVAANLERLYGLFDYPASAAVTAAQVHANRVAVARAQDRGKRLESADALITDVPGLPLLLRYADCVPVLLFDPVRLAVGVVHAGWRGTVMQVVSETVRAMSRAFATRPHDLLACIGPSIGPCCYCVGESVVEQVHRAFPEPDGLLSTRSGNIYFDLWQANARQLAALGVEHIEIAGLCTADHTDDFYSARREAYRTGRFGAVIVLDGSAS